MRAIERPLYSLSTMGVSWCGVLCAVILTVENLDALSAIEQMKIGSQNS